MRSISLLACLCATLALAAADSAVIHAESAKQFDEIVAASKGSAEVLVVDFYADWCGPCKMLAPVLEEVAKDHPGKVKILKVDVDKLADLAARFEVRSIPLVHIYKDGAKTGEFVGFLPKDKVVAALGL